MERPASDKSSVICPKCGHSFPLDDALASPPAPPVRRKLDELVRRVGEQAARAKAAAAAEERELADPGAGLEAAIDKAMATRRIEILGQARTEALATSK